MTLPKPKVGKKATIIAALALVLTSGTTVTLAYANTKKVEPQPVAVEEQMTSETVETKEPEPTPVEEPKPAPQVAAPKPVPAPVAQPVDAAVALKEEAKNLLINYALSQGYKNDTSWGSAYSQWVCMEKMLIKESVPPTEYANFINKRFIVGDFRDQQEGNQRIAFDGPGTCNMLVYTR